MKETKIKYYLKRGVQALKERERGRKEQKEKKK